MNKKILAILSWCLLLTACSNTNKSEIKLETPYSILYEDTFFNYYDTQDTLNSTIDTSNIIFNDTGFIRAITITNSDFMTYPNISVGDDKSKIEETFEFEYENKNSYMVLFDGITEINPTIDEKGDNWIWITYNIEDDKISQISIYDVKYGREMR